MFVLISLRLSFGYDSGRKPFFRSKVGKLEIRDKNKKISRFSFFHRLERWAKKKKTKKRWKRSSTISADNKISFHARFFFNRRASRYPKKRNRITLPRISYRTIRPKFNNNSTYIFRGWIFNENETCWLEEYSIRSSKLVTRSRSLLNSSMLFYKQEQFMCIHIYISLSRSISVSFLFYGGTDILLSARRHRSTTG